MWLRRCFVLALFVPLACNNVEVEGGPDGGGAGQGGGAGGTPGPVDPGVHVDMDCGNGTLVLAVCQPPDLIVVEDVSAAFECYSNNGAFVGAFFEHPELGAVLGTQAQYAVINGRCPGMPRGFNFTIDTRNMAGDTVNIQTFDPGKKLEGRFQSADGLFKGTFSIVDNVE